MVGSSSDATTWVDWGMGLRGPGAKPLLLRRETLEAVTSQVYPWDAPGLTRPDRVIAFVEDLTVSSGKATNQKLRLRPWQRKFLKAVYREDKRGVRPVRTAVLSMARKNGKSQLAAALALCHLCGPEAESRGEIYSCANDRFESARIFNEMVALINRHPALSARTNITSLDSRSGQRLHLRRADRRGKDEVGALPLLRDL